MEDDQFPITKIQISGATLASLLHRSSSSSGDLHGYLFGLSAVTIPTCLSDHPTPLTPSTTLTTTITSFLSLPSHLPLPPPPPNAPLLGHFSSRRKTPLRPSLKDTTTTLSLSLNPSLLLLVTTPFHDQLTHTHEYKAFQYKGNTFEAKSLDIVNIGPSFRSQYESFSPNVGLPMVNWESRGSNAMAEDEKAESLADRKRRLKDQKEMDMVAEGFGVDRLGGLVGSDAAYTGDMEDLYDKMLAKIDGLSRLVEQSNAKVLEQENYNMRLRCKVAGLE